MKNGERVLFSVGLRYDTRNLSLSELFQNTLYGLLYKVGRSHYVNRTTPPVPTSYS